MFSEKELVALRRCERHFGVQWKAKLRKCFQRSSYPGMLSEVVPELQGIEVRLGCRWLVRFKFPEVE